jgi:hypothetical protein
VSEIWHDPLLPNVKAGRVLQGAERQAAIDAFIVDLICKERTELSGLLVEYVNRYRLRRKCGGVSNPYRRAPLTSLERTWDKAPHGRRD